ncbi:hypothetical protein CC86DRAFT_316413 [Ophiobolus disseminans]|uniref:Rhodopsin domain-containing protein n=1 Tax=Ophiobolus disseminans TaxID=1469910 RepID=A0A6A7AD74_9PLEO|nr:hypothetical protein CC86DRAFT_316413 [Ophiobolus disseminans]
MSARDDRSAEFTAVLGFFIAICTLLVLLRCYCKVVIVKSFAADDYFSLLTLVSFLVFCTLALLGISNGTGKKSYLIPPERLPNGMKWWWSCEPTYVITNIFLKFSIGIFLLRIAVDKTHRMILLVALIAIQVYSVYFFFIFTFQCWPISFFWEQFRGGKGKCIPSNIVVNSFYGYSALSCVTDWTFSIVPIFIVRKLQMSRRKKYTVGALLALCALGSTATIIRIPYIDGLNDIPEFLYSTIDVAIWSTCETGIGLAASAGATLRPLLRQVFGELSTHGTSSRKHSRMWAGAHPSRSGYKPHPSQGDHNEIPLTGNDAEFGHVNIVSGGNSSPPGSSTGWKDWDHEQKSWNTSSGDSNANNTGIMKTVKITQL